MFLGKDSRIIDDRIASIKSAIKINYASKRVRFFWGFLFLFNVGIATGEIIAWTGFLNDIMRLAPTTGFITVKFQFLFKVGKLFLEEKRITRLFSIVENQFWNTDVTPTIKADINFKFMVLNYIIIVFGSGSLTLSVFYTCFPVMKPIEGVRQMPYEIWLPFDYSRDGLYQMCYWIMGMNGTAAIAGILLFDFHFIYFTQHLFAQFETLTAVLENMCNVDNINSDEEEFQFVDKVEFQDNIEAKLKACIEHYKLLLAFWEDEEQFFSTSLTIQMAFTGLLSIMIGFCAMEEDDIITSIKYFLLFMCIAVQMFLYTYHGSELQEKTMNVANGAYCSNWYVANRKIQKSLVFFIMGAQNELKLSASGLLDVNNTSFVQIFQTTFSFITLLRSFNEEQDE